jgi:hypothetical protein
MKGHRDEKVETGWAPIMVQPLCHPLSQEGGEVGLSFIFPPVDRLLKRPLVISQRPCFDEIFFFLQTSSTSVVSGLRRKKRGAADSAKRSFDPVNP